MDFIDEKIVENKTCQQCQVSFNITDKDLEFYEKVSPVFAGKKYSIPTPKLCPECRQQRRLSLRNLFNFYKRKCDHSGEDLISIYHEKQDFPVYNQEFWWGDQWDALDYGIEFNTKQSFITQWKQLYNTVPKIALMNNDCENCSYCNFSKNSKNCYLVIGNINNENCLYSHILWRNLDCIDCLYVKDSSLCSYCVDCKDCFNLNNAINCQSSKNSQYVYNCINCEFCFGCVGLENKKYCIFNKQYSKKEYEEKIVSCQNNMSQEDIFKKIKELKNTSIDLFYNGNNIEFSSGNYLYNVTNVYSSYDVENSQDLKYCTTIGNFTDSYDCNYSPGSSEKSYEGLFMVGYNNIFSHNVIECNHMRYCDSCFNSSDLFGCIGLKNKQYCILNKQYTKEEYNILVPQIIEYMKTSGEWGEFFPSTLSPFGYNETVAQEYFPLEKENAIKQNFNWSDYEAPLPKVDKIISANKLPDNLADIPDDILNWAIECEITKKPFKIIAQELAFYRKHNLPIPRKHPDQRHLERMQLRNPRKLYKRDCDKCSIEMNTTYAPEREERVYCEVCYRKEIY